MFRARRRPLMRAAMVGGAGYLAGKKGAQSAEAEQQQQQQPQQQQAPPPVAPAPAAGGTDVVSKLKELSDMKASGALSDAEFEAAKAQLLGGGS